MENNLIDLKSFTLEELQMQLKALSLPTYKVLQIYQWLHQKFATGFDKMTNLSKELRQQLEERYFINQIEIADKLISKNDGTVKYLYRLQDGELIEAVLMKYKHGNSLCISTQVGCRMGCKFCASTLGGLVRCLKPSEMLDEVYMAQKDSGEKVSSIVLMGIGEPLDNFENVVQFLKILSSKEGLNLSLRHVSLSTCGLVDKIYQLAQLKLQLTLSISLHAPNNEMRDKIMPVNHKYKVEELLKACRDYFATTGRRISFEYSLIDGVNDTPECARQLADLIKGMGAHVNLIPINKVKERSFHKSTQPHIKRFLQTLQSLGVNATVRRELGSDINAACGQLRRDREIREGSL